MDRIPSNIILKSQFNMTKPHFYPKYQIEIINEIMRYISSTDQHYYDNLEIEAKLGHFEFKGSAIMSFARIQETFLIPEFLKMKEFAYEFAAGISPDCFYLVWNAMEYEVAIPNSEIKSLGAMTYHETHYKSGKRKSIIYRNGEEIGEEIIRKENKKHFNVRNFSNDFRITCSREMPTDISEDDVEEMQRKKFRTSYEFSFYRVDFTITTTSKTGFSVPVYEIEIELSQLKTFLANQPINFEALKTLLERFIQNILCVYTTTTIESVMMITKKKNSDSSKSIFGNYLENNIPKNNNDSKEKDG